MNADGRAIANFVLDVCEADGRGISNLALQKIVYFCHAWILVKHNKPLIRHHFEAWQYGPVLQYLYRDFNEFENKPITNRARKLNPVTGEKEVVAYSLDTETETLLRKVVSFYSRLNAGTLVELSHADDGPWHEVWHHGEKVKPGMKIEDDSIRSYYSKKSSPF